MIYKVTKNGDTTLLTHSYKNAAKEYDRLIYYGKPSDIIALYVKRDDIKTWELARKDWM